MEEKKTVDLVMAFQELSTIFSISRNRKISTAYSGVAPFELVDNAALLMAYVFKHLSNISSQSSTIPSFPPVTKPCEGTHQKNYVHIKMTRYPPSLKRISPWVKKLCLCFLPKYRRLKNLNDNIILI